MILSAMRLKGACIIEIERIQDCRGFFARSWCQREFAQRGLNPELRQCNISFNANRGTLRGLHYQIKPYEEARLVRCTRGRIYDVILDLRPDSPTFKQWIGVELTAENRKMVYVPEGFAHGFQTLEDDSEMFYQMSQFYSATHARRVRWNDPTFAIEWPEPPSVISERDQRYADFVSVGIKV